MKVKNSFSFSFTTLFLPLSLWICCSSFHRTTATVQLYQRQTRDSLDNSENMRVKLSSLRPSQLLPNYNPQLQPRFPATVIQQNIPSNINAIEQYSREKTSNSPNTEQAGQSNPNSENADKIQGPRENNFLPVPGKDVSVSEQNPKNPPPLPDNNVKDSATSSAVGSNIGVISFPEVGQQKSSLHDGIFKVPLPPDQRKSYNNRQEQNVLPGTYIPSAPRFPGPVATLPQQNPQPVTAVSSASGPVSPTQPLLSPMNGVSLNPGRTVIPSSNQIKEVSPSRNSDAVAQFPFPIDNLQTISNSENENKIPLPSFRTIKNKPPGTSFTPIMHPGGFPGYTIDMAGTNGNLPSNSNDPQRIGSVGEFPGQNSHSLGSQQIQSMQNIPNVQPQTPLPPPFTANSNVFRGQPGQSPLPPQLPVNSNVFRGQLGQSPLPPQLPVNSNVMQGQRGQSPQPPQFPVNSNVMQGQRGQSSQPPQLPVNSNVFRGQPGQSPQPPLLPLNSNVFRGQPGQSQLPPPFPVKSNIFQGEPEQSPLSPQIPAISNVLRGEPGQSPLPPQFPSNSNGFIGQPGAVTTIGGYSEPAPKLPAGQITSLAPNGQSNRLKIVPPSYSQLQFGDSFYNNKPQPPRPQVLKGAIAPRGSLLESTAQMKNIQPNTGPMTPSVTSSQSPQTPNTMALNTILSSPPLSAMNPRPRTPVRKFPAFSNMNTITSRSQDLTEQPRIVFSQPPIEYRERRYFPDQQNPPQQVSRGSVAAIIPLQRNVPQTEQKQSYPDQRSSQFTPALQNQQIPVSIASQSQYMEQPAIRDQATRLTPSPALQFIQNRPNPSQRGRFVGQNERIEGNIPNRRTLQSGAPYRYIQSGQIQESNKFQVPGTFLQTLANRFPNQQTGRGGPYSERESQGRYQPVQYPGIKERREFLQRQQQARLRNQENPQQEQIQQSSDQARIQQIQSPGLQTEGRLQQIQTQRRQMGRQFQKQIPSTGIKTSENFQQIPTPRFQAPSGSYQNLQIGRNPVVEPFQQIQAPGLQAGGQFQQLQPPTTRQGPFPYGGISGPYSFTGKILPGSSHSVTQPQVMQQYNYGVGNSPVTPCALSQATQYGSGYRPYAYDGQIGPSKANPYQRPTPYVVPEYRRPVEAPLGSKVPFSGRYNNVQALGNPVLQPLQPSPRFPPPSQPSQPPQNPGGGNPRANPYSATTSGSSNDGTKSNVKGDINDNRGSNNRINNPDAQPRTDVRSHEIPAGSLRNLQTVQKLEDSASASQTASPILPRHRGEMPFYSQSQVDSHHRRLLENKETKEDREFESDPTILQWYLRRAKQVLRPKLDNNTKTPVPSEQGGNDAVSANDHPSRTESVVSAPISGHSNTNPQLPSLLRTAYANSNPTFGTHESGKSTGTKSSAATGSAPNPPDGIRQSPNPVSTDVLQQRAVNDNSQHPGSDKTAQLTRKARSTSFEDLFDFVLETDLSN